MKIWIFLFALRVLITATVATERAKCMGAGPSADVVLMATFGTEASEMHGETEGRIVQPLCLKKPCGRLISAGMCERENHLGRCSYCKTNKNKLDACKDCIGLPQSKMI